MTCIAEILNRNEHKKGIPTFGGQLKLKLDFETGGISRASWLITESTEQPPGNVLRKNSA